MNCLYMLLHKGDITDKQHFFLLPFLGFRSVITVAAEMGTTMLNWASDMVSINCSKVAE